MSLNDGELDLESVVSSVDLEPRRNEVVQYIHSIVNVDLPTSKPKLMHLCKHSRLSIDSFRNFILEPIERFGSFTGVGSLWDESDAAESRQDKFWRLVAYAFHTTHRCLGIRDVDLTYQPQRGRLSERV